MNLLVVHRLIEAVSSVEAGRGLSDFIDAAGVLCNVMHVERKVNQSTKAPAKPEPAGKSAPAGKAETIHDGMKLATQSLESGATAAALEKLIAVSNEQD